MGLFDSLFGGGDRGFDAATEASNRNRSILDQIELPEYSSWVPELYKTESADYQLMQEDPLVRSMQMQALQQMAGLAETGMSDIDRAGFAQARNEAGQIARSNSQAALQNAQARGVAGSGMEFAMREMGNQAATERARMSNMEQAAAAARQRALYNQAYSQGLGNMRTQDASTSRYNTDVINQFNSKNTDTRNRANWNNTDTTNDAFKYNEGLKDKRFGNQMSKATGQMGINSREAEIAAAKDEQRRRRNSSVGGLVGTGIGAAVGGAPGAAIGGGIGSALF